ncbi:MAG: hypothetical protein KJ558_01130 [Gammaproteobacteria bacterium]|nr:hypothetical protein [Gammaproteobacteria bacterium]MBU1653439.1 hypothetical protein [Gammaproteobacteria bacterium]MBU1959744.1 hypothetical protein [Gammaproteobacteria bacterium]
MDQTQEPQLPDSLDFEFSLKPNPDEELGQYVLSFWGKAIHWDDAGEELVVGEISGHRLDIALAVHDDFDPTQLFDSVVPEIADFAETVLRNKSCILPESVDAEVPQADCECLVFISELKVGEAHRGRGLGSALLRRMGRMIDLTNCLIALKAFPLADELGKPAEPEEIARVKRFYERHSFIHAGGEFMIKDARLCDAMRKKMALRKGR